MKEQKTEEQEEFLRKLSKAVSETVDTAQFEGICPQCFGTQKEMQKEGDYWGVAARKDGDIYTFLKCTHGEDLTDTFSF